MTRRPTAIVAWGWSTGWATLCGVLYALLSLRQFARFTVSSWDNAIFEQAVKSYAHGHWPIADLKGPGFNLLGDHFSPIIAVLAPFYRLFPSAQTILVAQCVLLALSVGVVTALALRRLGTPRGLAAGVAYGLSFGVQSAVAVDFHEVAFAAPLLALAGSAYVERRWTAVVVWSLPLLLVKEDLGITVALIGALVWWAGQWRRGVVLVVVGLLGALLVVGLIVPHVNPADTYDYTEKLHGGAWHILWTDPGRKAWTVVLTFAITGLAALASPWALLVLPTFAWRFVGDNTYYWGTDFHYSLVLMPIVFVALVDAAGREQRWVWVRRWAAVAPVAAVGFVAATLSTSPLAALVHREIWQASPRAEAARGAIAAVPRGASVETDIGLITHLVTHHTVYWVGTVGDEDPRYVLLDSGSGIGSPTDVVTYAQQQHGGTWTLTYDRDGYQVARRTP